MRDGCLRMSTLLCHLSRRLLLLPCVAHKDSTVERGTIEDANGSLCLLRLCVCYSASTFAFAAEDLHPLGRACLVHVLLQLLPLGSRWQAAYPDLAFWLEVAEAELALALALSSSLA